MICSEALKLVSRSFGEKLTVNSQNVAEREQSKLDEAHEATVRGRLSSSDIFEASQVESFRCTQIACGALLRLLRFVSYVQSGPKKNVSKLDRSVGGFDRYRRPVQCCELEVANDTFVR